MGLRKNLMNWPRLSANFAEPTTGSGVAEYRVIVVIVISLVTLARLVTLQLIAVQRSGGLPSHNIMKESLHYCWHSRPKWATFSSSPLSEDQVTRRLASGLRFLGPASWIVALWLWDSMEDWIHVPYVQFVTRALSPDRIVPYGFEKPTVPVTNASSDGYAAYVEIRVSTRSNAARLVFDFTYVGLGD